MYNFLSKTDFQEEDSVGSVSIYFQRLGSAINLNTFSTALVLLVAAIDISLNMKRIVFQKDLSLYIFVRAVKFWVFSHPFLSLHHRKIMA